MIVQLYQKEKMQVSVFRKTNMVYESASAADAEFPQTS